MASGNGLRVVKERQATPEEMEALPTILSSVELDRLPRPTAADSVPSTAATESSSPSSLSERQAQALLGTMRAIGLILNARLLLLLVVLGDFALCWTANSNTSLIVLGAYQIALILTVLLAWAKG